MLCGFARDLQDAGTNGHPVDLTLSSRAVAEHMRALGYGTGKSSVGDHLGGRCACVSLNNGGAKLHPKASGVKILSLDIENTPNIVHAWGLYGQNISINQVVQPAATIGVGYKWYHQDKAHFLSDHEHGHDEMVRRTHELLSAADIVVGFNSTSFDLPHLSREFVMAGLEPPKPYRQVDLLRVARKQFRFTSNKLDFLAQQFGLGSKTQHEGHNLWTRCMAGDADAWETMGIYCRQDVELTEALYDRLRGWIPNHPHLSMFTGSEWGCPNCGNPDVSTSREGEAYTNVQRYRAYKCSWCRTSIRGTQRLQDATHTRRIAS